MEIAFLSWSQCKYLFTIIPYGGRFLSLQGLILSVIGVIIYLALFFFNREASAMCEVLHKAR